jgi:hypothetical protein
MSGSVRLVVLRGAARKSVRLDDYVDAAAEEAARDAERIWIKQLRHARVDAMPLRRRFTLREDSLWWFAELYLHKEQAVLRIVRTLAALERLADEEAPAALEVTSADPVAGHVLAAFCAARGLGTTARRAPWPDRAALARMDARSAWLHGAALASRLRSRKPPRPAGQVAAAAFVHQAFVRGGSDTLTGESYIGPVLEALGRRLPAGALTLVGLGPAANFKARRWWHPVAGASVPPVTPIESYAPYRRLAPARGIWRARHAWRRALWGSRDLRGHAVIRGCDCWPVIARELAGVALLQWPWSARAMDEAGAALDALEPAVAVTYAEAGGWGRALVLEARRRGIPSAGLQHGFIYRHWLNYRHEPDEMQPDPGHAQDAGFPHPSATLLFDGFAAAHLEQAGAFPAGTLTVTGSPRLDALAEAVRTISPAEVLQARDVVGAAPDDALALVVTKQREAAAALAPVLAAAERLPGVRIVIKAHPAETVDVYQSLVQGRRTVSVLPAAAPLAPLLAAARAVVTVNSTLALDAAVLDLPALVVGLPNNLSPFVAAGMLAAGEPATMDEDLRRILYDEEFRHRLAEARREVLARCRMGSDGRAAERAADAVLRLAGRG